MNRILPQEFFNRPTVEVARDLLGKHLVRVIDGERIMLPIMEVEAYDGFDDRASHAHKGQTERNAVMFGEAGYWYVYLVYGMHFMLNIVTGPKDYPAAVLIRGAGGVVGPGRITKHLRVDKTQNGVRSDLASGLFLEESGVVVPPRQVKRTPRIGVAYAGPVWSQKKYRFVWEQHEPNETRCFSKDGPC